MEVSGEYCIPQGEILHSRLCLHFQFAKPALFYCNKHAQATRQVSHGQTQQTTTHCKSGMECQLEATTKSPNRECYFLLSMKPKITLFVKRGRMESEPALNFTSNRFSLFSTHKKSEFFVLKMFDSCLLQQEVNNITPGLPQTNSGNYFL